MKKSFTEPTIEVVLFEDNVIITSNGNDYSLPFIPG